MNERTNKEIIENQYFSPSFFVTKKNSSPPNRTVSLTPLKMNLLTTTLVTRRPVMEKWRPVLTVSFYPMAVPRSSPTKPTATVTPPTSNTKETPRLTNTNLLTRHLPTLLPTPLPTQPRLTSHDNQTDQYLLLPYWPCNFNLENTWKFLFSN